MISAFWFFNLIMPLAIFFTSAIIRYGQDIPQTATTDFLSLFIGIDSCIYFNRMDFSNHIKYPGGIEEIANSVYILTLVTAIFWCLCLLKVEPALEKYYNNKAKNVQTSFPFLKVIMAWASNAGILTSHILFVIGRLNLWSPS